MWAAIPFFTSLVLLVAFIVFRFEEEKRGKKIFAHTREEADVVIADLYHRAVMGNIPTHFRVTLVALFRKVSHAVVVFTVELLRALERPLARLSYRMRRDVPTGTGKAPSDFLKTIRPSKKDGDGTTPDSGV